MSNNDQILLDSILNKMNESATNVHDSSEQFELFSFDQILKDYDLSSDELGFGWVDGSDDGGIDGFFTFIDGRIITDAINATDYRRNAEIEIVIITCKHKDSFYQAPISSILASIKELFDLSLESNEISSPFNEDVLQARNIFRDAYIELAAKNPTLKIRYIYTSRGDSQKIASNVNARAELLKTETSKQFGQALVTFNFVGATELLNLYRKSRQFSLRLKFIESVISRSNNSYIVLCRLDDYFHFVSDDSGKLRRYLFDSNVRDYLQGSLINQDIAATLRSGDSKESADFWLLNNGVTVLTSNASNIGKEMSLENIQIVNGLQTTETIYNYFSGNPQKADDRAVLVKIIVAKDEMLRDRIIKATNNQNKVDLSNLKATDKHQRDIEEVLLENEWYYDRRKNYYRNLEKPSDRIISVPYLSQAILALCLKRLDMAAKSRPSYMTNESTYGKLFDEKWNIRVYLAVVEIRKTVEQGLAEFNFNEEMKWNPKRKYGMLFAYIYANTKLKKRNYLPNDLIKIINKPISADELGHIWMIIQEAIDRYKIISGSTQVKRPQRNAKFLEVLEDYLDEIIVQK